MCDDDLLRHSHAEAGALVVVACDSPRRTGIRRIQIIPVESKMSVNRFHCDNMRPGDTPNNFPVVEASHPEREEQQTSGCPHQRPRHWLSTTLHTSHSIARAIGCSSGSRRPITERPKLPRAISSFGLYRLVHGRSGRITTLFRGLVVMRENRGLLHRWPELPLCIWPSIWTRISVHRNRINNRPNKSGIEVPCKKRRVFTKILKVPPPIFDHLSG
jgi:hypothetical protein